MASLKDLLQNIVDGITGVNTAVGSMELVVDGQGKDLAAIKADVASIKTTVAAIQFSIDGGTPPPLSAEDQQALDSAEQRESDLAKQAADLATQAGSINTNQP